MYQPNSVNGVPVLLSQANVLSTMPDVPQSSHDRLTPSAAAGPAPVISASAQSNTAAARRPRESGRRTGTAPWRGVMGAPSTRAPEARPIGSLSLPLLH